jgi:NTP pyrophosphatase (non-canonical NTP hydrolase)
MNLKTYQEMAHEFAQYGMNAMYPALGLAEEAGEVAGKIAKYIRKHNGQMPPCHDTVKLATGDDEVQFHKDLSKELGDVCWMVAELCTVYGLDLEEVMEENIAKLNDRKARGVIVGSGDNR